LNNDLAKTILPFYLFKVRSFEPSSCFWFAGAAALLYSAWFIHHRRGYIDWSCFNSKI